ncbi:hypothetical protein NLU13_9916 [Sarocladium strictum]|uniref:Uncharacterized protein n=1 Tax=Sarocladium strictum TaxID=5046 RepID=A0AA39G965_SARSR|nr:hypothetical protein NLU13_9916 [Sarocladium strictum]
MNPYAYLIPPAIVIGLGFFAAAGVFMSSLKTVKTYEDPGWRTFLFTKTSLGFYTFGLLLHFIATCLQAVNFSPREIWDHDRTMRISIATACIRELADVLVSFSDATALIVLALLERSIDGTTRNSALNRGSKIIVVLSGFVAAFIAVIAVTCWVTMIYIHRQVSSIDSGIEPNLGAKQNSIKLMMWLYYLALCLMSFIFSFRTFWGLSRYTREARNGKACEWLFLAKVFFAVRAVYLLGRSSQILTRNVSNNLGVYSPGFVIIDPIFGTLPILGTLIVLHRMGKKEDEGIWFHRLESEPHHKQVEEAGGVTRT